MMNKIIPVIFGIFALFLAGCDKDNGAPLSAENTPAVERLNISDEELQKIVAHSPASPEKIESVLHNVLKTLELVKREKLPKNFPNWIAFHTALIYNGCYVDYCEGRNTDENVKRVFTTLQNSDTKELGPFVMRSGLPFPQHSGHYFMREHHPDQFLHYFTMASGTLDAPLIVDDKAFTFRDVFERSLLEARTTNELAYTIMLYAKFLESGKRWNNKFGESMSLAILLEKLLKTPEKTCLGTHRLGALAGVYARKELKNDKEIAKLWSELERQIFETLARLKQSQKPDGSFEPPGLTSGSQTPENIVIYYTGHSLEWLMLLDNDYSGDDWVIRGFDKLNDTITLSYIQIFRNLDAVRNEESHFDFDGLCHAVSALNLWKNSLESKRIVDRVIRK
jgi:hypothetical protein